RWSAGCYLFRSLSLFFFFQAEDGIRDFHVTGVQTCALPIFACCIDRRTAPRGTPIYAAGDGTVTRANYFGSYGNYVSIRHANGYITAYAHMNGFARGIKAGTRVRQGQVIGYVGTTGRSTGPHLHYEVHVNGKKMNPLALKVPTGRKLEGKELAAFKAQRETVATQ